MLQSLQQFEVAPLVTNIEFLQDLMRCESFVNADLDTGLIERERQFLLDRQAANSETFERHAVLVASAILAHDQKVAKPSSPDPWDSTNGFRLYQPLERTIELVHQDTPVKVICRYAQTGFTLQVQHTSGALSPLICLANPALINGQLHATLGSETVRASIFFNDHSWIVFDNAVAHVFSVKPSLSWTTKAQLGSGSVTAPMPGKIVALLASVGSPVTAGQALVVMEAMKMEHTLSAPTVGVLKEFLCQVGDQVADGALLLRLEQSEIKT
jgi:3-methylcrotonyl-CoA carboxylase alpha subunit